jgi:hypothetical protein
MPMANRNLEGLYVLRCTPKKKTHKTQKAVYKPAYTQTHTHLLEIKSYSVACTLGPCRSIKECTSLRLSVMTLTCVNIDTCAYEWLCVCTCVYVALVCVCTQHLVACVLRSMAGTTTLPTRTHPPVCTYPTNVPFPLARVTFALGTYFFKCYHR